MGWSDPVVEEVRRERERLLQDAGGFKSYVQKLKLKEQEHAERLVPKGDLRPGKCPSNSEQDGKVN